MRTTIRLDDQILADAKALAARTGRTLTQVIQDSLQRALARPAEPAAGGPVRLPTFGGRGIRPGVDLDDTAGLVDTMESRARS